MKATHLKCFPRFFAAILFLISPTGARCQGIAAFDNGGLSSPPDRLVRFASATTPGNPFGTNLAPVVGSQFRAQLYYGAPTAVEGSLIPVTEAPAVFLVSTATLPGTWIPHGGRALSGFGQGDIVNLQVRVWDITFGSTYDETQGAGTQGKSLMFQYFIPFEPAPPPGYSMRNFQGFIIDIPEASALPLTALGLSIMFSCRFVPAQKHYPVAG